MEAHVERLIVVLEQIEGQYDRMVAIIERETKAATEADAVGLTALGEEKQTIIARLKGLDQKRLHLLGAIAAHLGLSAGRLTISTLLQHVGRSHRLRLSRLQADLGVVLNRVHTAGDECRSMVRHCLRLVQNTLGFFQHCTRDREIYGASGCMRSEPLQNGRLVSGEV